MRADKSLLARRPKRRYGFALMPLADTMFQLLIFFMLSSSLTPFSTLTLRSASLPEAQSTERVAPSGVQVWTLGEDAIVTDGVSHAYAQRADLAQSVADGGPAAAVVVVVQASAQIQHVAWALEALSLAGVTRVQISPEGG